MSSFLRRTVFEGIWCLDISGGRLHTLLGVGLVGGGWNEIDRGSYLPAYLVIVGIKVILLLRIRVVRDLGS